MRRRRIVIVLLASTLALAACGTSGGKGSASSGASTTASGQPPTVSAEDLEAILPTADVVGSGFEEVPVEDEEDDADDAEVERALTEACPAVAALNTSDDDTGEVERAFEDGEGRSVEVTLDATPTSYSEAALKELVPAWQACGTARADLEAGPMEIELSAEENLELGDYGVDLSMIFTIEVAGDSFTIESAGSYFTIDGVGVRVLGTGTIDQDTGEPVQIDPTVVSDLSAEMEARVSELTSGSSAGTTTTALPTGANEVSATLTDTAIEGIPDDLKAGVVEVTVTDSTTGGGAFGEVNFALVDEGTTEEEFKAGLGQVSSGAPYPDFMRNAAGVVDEGAIVLEQGRYIVWIDKASALDRDSTPEDLITTVTTVAPGTAEAVLPDADGSITATDYAYAVDVRAGMSTVNFTNSSDEQFHRVILIDFGVSDPALVEEHLAEILQSEDGSVPEGIDGTQMDYLVGESSVFGPGSSGSFTTDLIEGNTYAAVCFATDVQGGAPHAFQHQMTKVFTAS